MDAFFTMDASKVAEEWLFRDSCKRILLDRDTKELVDQFLITHRSCIDLYFDRNQEHEQKISLYDMILGCHQKRSELRISAWKNSIEAFKPEKSALDAQ